MMFALGGQKVTFRTNPAFMPKVFDHTGSGQAVDLMAFHLKFFKFQVSSFICHIHDYTETV